MSWVCNEKDEAHKEGDDGGDVKEREGLESGDKKVGSFVGRIRLDIYIYIHNIFV